MNVAASNEGPNMSARLVKDFKLTKSESESIRAFLKNYDQYARKVEERPQKNLRVWNISKKVSRSDKLKLCPQSKWVGFVTDLDFLPDTLCYALRSNEALRMYLKEKAAALRPCDSREDGKVIGNEFSIPHVQHGAHSKMENVVSA